MDFNQILTLEAEILQILKQSGSTEQVRAGINQLLPVPCEMTVTQGYGSFTVFFFGRRGSRPLEISNA